MLKYIVASPLLMAFFAAAVAFLYFFLMTFSPNLPPAMIFSAMVGYFVYLITTQGGLAPSSSKSPSSATPTTTK